MKWWDNMLKKHYKKLGYSDDAISLRMCEYNGSLIKAVGIFFVFMVVLGAVLFMPYLDMKSRTSNFYYSEISDMYEEDVVVSSIADVCVNMATQEKQIRCVNNFVNEFFYFDRHNNEIKVFRTPLEIINKGGCCRDYTIFYNSILSLMGFESEFIYEPGHVYLRIFGDEENFIVDQQLMAVEGKNGV